MSAETKLSSVFDRLGVEIKPGDRVCYPVRQSSSMWMRDGTVLAVRSLPDERYYYDRSQVDVRDDAGHKHTIRIMDRVTVLCSEGAVGLLPTAAAAGVEMPLALWDRLVGWVRSAS